MKLKAVITDGTPEPVVSAMSSKEFASSFLTEVVSETLGAEDAFQRPAEYYVQVPDRTIFTGGGFGVELRLTGVSRNGRSAKQFHNALKRLHQIAEGVIYYALIRCTPGTSVQLFTVLELDGEIETSPGSGEYSRFIEHPAEWVTARPTENPVNEKTHGI